MNNTNYQKELDIIINNLENTPSLLLHSCCAPCSSYCIEYLSEYFKITVLYYNPNMDTEDEYNKRAEEQQRLINSMNTKYPVKLVTLPYLTEEYHSKIKGLEEEKEGGARCKVCFNLRLKKTAMYAQLNNFDYFATTLTISPLKNANIINKIGYLLSDYYKVKWLPSDFKKKNGFKRSIELSNEYNLYRQDYCGCEYSKRK
jgi:predicted adenine nucleotide alpha hydrolase (AANH) superfamily ATPase